MEKITLKSILTFVEFNIIYIYIMYNQQLSFNDTRGTLFNSLFIANERLEKMNNHLEKNIERVTDLLNGVKLSGEIKSNDEINKEIKSIQWDKETLLDPEFFVESNTQINKLMTEIQTLKANIDQLHEVINKIKIKYNQLKIGTLEGITRRMIKEKNIPVDNEVINNILEQPYNEEEISNYRKGGKKRRTKKTYKKRRCSKKLKFSI